MTDELDRTIPPEKLPAQWIPRTELEPNDWNPNKIDSGDMNALQDSIANNGWTQPIVVSDDGTIIDGEQRWRAAGTDEIADNESLTPESMPADMVPVHGIEVDDGDARIATVQHNRARGHLSQDKLADYLKDLENSGVVETATNILNISDDRRQLLLEDATSAGEIGVVEDEYNPTWEPTDVTETDEDALETETRSDSVRENKGGEAERIVGIYRPQEAEVIQDTLGEDSANELNRLVEEIRSSDELTAELHKKMADGS